MIPHATIRAIADSVHGHILEGVKAVHAGELLTAELHFSLAQQALLKLQRLIDADAATQKPPPLRRFYVIGPAREEEDRFPEVREYEEEPLPRWMETKKGGPDGSAA